jgi:ribosomal protein S26
VCVSCSFHHLVRKWRAGDRRQRKAQPAQQKKARS